MGKKQGNSSVPCRVDHGGRYRQIPEAVLDAALPVISSRAIGALLVLLRRMNGFNNGKIALSSRDLGDALGNQNYSANSAALYELQRGGLIELVTTHPKGKRMAREYRLTFVHCENMAATHEWRECLAAMKKETGKQFRPPETSTETGKPVEGTATRWKRSVEDIATDATETSGLEGFPPAEDIAAHIFSHTPASHVVPFPMVANHGKCPSAQNGGAWMAVDELRQFASGFIAWAGAGAQTALAKRSAIPGGTLSKFLNGRGLSDQHRQSLQTSVGALWPLQSRTGAKQ